MGNPFSEMETEQRRNDAAVESGCTHRLHGVPPPPGSGAARKPGSTRGGRSCGAMTHSSGPMRRGGGPGGGRGAGQPSRPMNPITRTCCFNTVTAGHAIPGGGGEGDPTRGFRTDTPTRRGTQAHRHRHEQPGDRRTSGRSFYPMSRPTGAPGGGGFPDGSTGGTGVGEALEVAALLLGPRPHHLPRVGLAVPLPEPILP